MGIETRKDALNEGSAGNETNVSSDLGLNFKLVSAVIVNNRAQTVSMQQRISTFKSVIMCGPQH